MIDRIISWSLRNRFLVVCALLLVLAVGQKALREVPVDAIPDLSENQVVVYADWSGRSPQEVEDQVTYPLSAQMQGLAGVKAVRANSMFGFSLVTVIFEDKTDLYFARSRIVERLAGLGDLLPEGVRPKLGPDATGLGWVYQYYLAVDPKKAPAGGYDLGKLRAVQDWFIRYQLNAVHGVAEIGSIGGFVRQYQIEVSSARMRSVNMSLEEIMGALAESNLNVGGKVIEENGMEFVVRGVGLIRSAQDLENIVLRTTAGVSIPLRDVATVQVGGEFRRGALDVDGHEVVGGIVVMRSGGDAMGVIRDLKRKIAEISPSLPPGVSIVPFYDRSALIDRTIDTLRHALIEEIILVTLVHIIFLAHFRSILIVTLPLPLSILCAFIMMSQMGISSNVMSLSGIAIAIGVLVDAAIVITENILRRAGEVELQQGRPITLAQRIEVVREGARQVGRPIFFAMVIIILAFVPVFALTGQEGKLFHPLAATKTFAMIASTLLALTVVPVLCSFLVKGPFHAEESNWVMRFLGRLYEPVLRWALAHRLPVMIMAVGVLLVSLALAIGLPRAAQTWLTRNAPAKVSGAFAGVGSEFMPTLNEGSLLFMPVLLPSTSLTEVKRIMAWQDRVIKLSPEVLSVAGKLGRAETATDPAPVEMIETTITLKPQEEWRAGMTKAQLISELSERLAQVPGYVSGFLQPIENRILMVSTGIRAQLGVKILGDDMTALQAKALEVERIVREIPGAAGVAASRVQGKPYVEIEVDREALRRYGLRVQQVMAVIEAGVGGRNVGTAIQGRERWPIQVRFEAADRGDIERLRDLPVVMSDRGSVPLGQVAHIRRVVGPSEIASENGRLRVFVQANVQGRDLGGFVAEVQERIRKQVTLDSGMTVEYSGEFENQIRARHTLSYVVPMVLLIIFVLLYIVYGSAHEAAHVILAVPFALSGGLFLQWWLGYPFSVAVWVGYIALFGTAIQTGVVMVVYLEEALEKRRILAGGPLSAKDITEAVVAGARLRLRPKVMTVATIVASLMPIFWSTRPGAEIMRPLAAPVLGGMLSSLLHILIVTPVIVAFLREREERTERG